MPKIPILPQAPAGDDEFAALPPEQAEGLRRLEARDNSLGAGLALSEAWLAGLDEVQDAAEAPDGTPAGFARDFLTRTDKARAAALTRLPAAQRADADQALLDLRAELTDRAASAEASGQALRRRLGLRQALDNFSAGVRRDPGAFDSASSRMTALVDGLGLPAERAAALRREIADTLGNAAVDGLMAEPAEAAAMLDAGLFDDALSGEAKAARLAEARVLADREQLLARERTRGELLTLAGDGRAEEDVIAAAEAAGSLTAADAAQVRAADAAARQAAETKRMRIDRVVAADDSLDPDSAEDQAAVDAYWETVAEAHASDDPAQQQAAELTFVKTVGVLPKPLANRYRGGLLSGDPALEVQGAVAIAELESTDARLVSALPTGEVRRARAISEFAALDLPPERAVELGEQKVATEIEDIAAEDAASATSASDEIVDNDQADTPFVGFDEEEDERVSVFRGPDGAITVTDEDTGESVDVPPELAQAIEEAAEKNPEAVQLVAQMLAATEAREAGADTAMLLNDLDAWVDRVFPADAGSSRPTRFLNRRFKETMRRALEDPSAGLSAAGILLRQVDPDSLGEMLTKTAEGLAVLLGAVGGAGLARKLFGQFLQFTVSAVLQTRRQGLDFGPSVGEELNPAPVSPPTAVDSPDRVAMENLEAELNQQIEEAAKQSNFETVSRGDANRANEDFPSSWEILPYKQDTTTITVRLNAESVAEFVRVHSVENPTGRWIFRKEQLFDASGRKLTPAELQRRFALPGVEPPTEISDVVLPIGAELRIGAVNPLPGGESGDVVQYQFLEMPPDEWFTNRRSLSQ